MIHLKIDIKSLESIKGSEFVFDYVHLLYYKCHETNPNRGGSYIDCPNWIKTKKQQLILSIKKIINVKALTVVLNYEEIKKDLERITKIKPFINKYN